MYATIGIAIYCIIQIIGCIVVSRAIYVMVQKRKAELAKEQVHDRRQIR